MESLISDNSMAIQDIWYLDDDIFAVLNDYINIYKNNLEKDIGQKRFYEVVKETYENLEYENLKMNAYINLGKSARVEMVFNCNGKIKRIDNFSVKVSATQKAIVNFPRIFYKNQIFRRMQTIDIRIIKYIVALSYFKELELLGLNENVKNTYEEKIVTGFGTIALFFNHAGQSRADIFFENDFKIVNIKALISERDKVFIFMPQKREWDNLDKVFKVRVLKEIKHTYILHRNRVLGLSKNKIFSDKKMFVEPKADIVKKFDDDFTFTGRVKNSDKFSPFRYVPRTQVAYEKNINILRKNEKQRSYSKLILNANMGNKGSVGGVELDILVWIAKFGFLTNTMILDLFEAERIYSENKNLNKRKFSEKINRLEEYGLIYPIRFYVNENGEYETSTYKLLAKGHNFYRFLKYMNVEIDTYEKVIPTDDFSDIDADDLKRRMSVNQFMIHWLRFNDIVKSEDIQYSAVIENTDTEEHVECDILTYKDRMFICESLRTGEDEARADKLEKLDDKIGKIDSIVKGDFIVKYRNNKIGDKKQPVIVLIFENEDHIIEEMEFINKLKEKYPSQKIIISDDVRIYSYSEIRREFVDVTEDGHIVQLENEFIDVNLYDEYEAVSEA